MRTIYLDCGMGAAGDMLMAALLELYPDKEGFLAKMNGLGLPGVRVEAEEAVKCGITGTHMKITVAGQEEESLDVHDHGSACGEAHSHGGEVHVHVQDVGDHEHEGHDHEGHTHEAHDHEDHDHEAHVHGDHDHEAHVHGDHDHHDHGDHVHGDHDHEGHVHGDHTHEGHTHGGHTHTHHHADMAGVAHMISHLDLPEEVKADMTQVYGLIAEAESKAHGKPVDQIHFHEVGTVDAIVDVAGVCLLMHELAPEQVLASPVHVGSGHVHCAHGILPVPAPATAHILQGVPIYSTQIKGELCTPTGAALLKHFVKEFREMPVLTVSGIGYGMGKKDFERANCVRALLGETAETGGEVVELSCNLDDMTAEELGYVQEVLFGAGALEVYTIPVGMKKNRPGILLTCMCRREKEEELVRLLFKNTTTIGIREHVSRRFTLKREVETLETPFGAVCRKTSSGYGVTRSKLEYEDMARIAREQGMSLREVREAIERGQRDRETSGSTES